MANNGGHEQLNAQQQAAVAIQDGPALVVAGAGTGKTKVIVERIIRLINDGVDRQQILALTFTEKATQEMIDRVAEALPESFGVELNIFTFNGFGQEMLREFAIDIGLDSSLSLIGDVGKVVLLREHLDELELEYFSPVSNPDGQLTTIADYISKLKQQLITPDDYLKHAQALPSKTPEDTLDKQKHLELATAYKIYTSLCRTNNSIDYDDQIFLLVQLFEQRPNILKQLQQRFAYMLVDEFQDTNPMQSRLIDLLAAKTQNLMTVGDDDQSIYGWRGATLANILDFKKTYPNAQEITLIENYRSTQPILDAAYQLIQHNNPNRLEAIDNLDKRLHSQTKGGSRPHVRKFSSFDAELDWIAQDIKSKIDQGIDPGSIAVLSRRNAGAKKVHDILQFYEVEHVVAGLSTDMYTQPVITAMIEALKAVVDPKDNQALYHTLGGPVFNIDSQLLGEYAATARREHEELRSIIKSADDQKVLAALSQIDTWRDNSESRTVGELSYQILDDSGLKKSLYQSADKSESEAAKVKSLGQWFTSLKEFQQVSDMASTINYLDNFTALKASGETISDDSDLLDPNLVAIMSVHKAKGLEWDFVYIVDCTEYSFPLKNTRSGLAIPEKLTTQSVADDHMSEERRLMYVAMTRARQELVLTYSETHSGLTKRKPSRFILEIFGDEFDTSTTDTSSNQTTLDLFAEPTTTLNTNTLPPNLKRGNKLVLSASQLNDYLRCPLDFYYRHVLNVPQAPSSAAAIGTVFHAIIQQINEARMKGKDIPKLSQLEHYFDDNWPREGFLSATQRDRSKKQAKGSLTELYQRLQDDPVPLETEESFRVTIPEGNLTITGRIDAVLPAESGVEIRDYKTSTNVDSPEKAKRRAQSSKQLEMYALAWRSLHGEAPQLLSLDFIQTGHVGSVSKRASTIDNLQVKLSQVATSIEQGDFPPGRDHSFCTHQILD